MNHNRRVLLKGTFAAGATGIAISAGLLTPKAVLAAWPKAAFEAKDVKSALEGSLGSSSVTKSSDVKLKAPDIAEKLVHIAHRARNLKGHGLDEGISTRLLVYSGQLIAKGVAPLDACSMTMVTPLTDDPDMRDTLNAAVETFFG